MNVSTVDELQYAVGEMKTGDTILISDGIYNLTNTLVINNKPGKIFNVAITGKSGNREEVRIFAPGMGVYSQTAPHVFAVYNVENLLIQDLTAGKTYYHPITVQGNSGAENVYFKNLHLIDAGEQFIKINNKESQKCDNGIVEGCLIEYTDYPFWDGDSYYTQGIDKIGGGDNWIIRDCIIKNIRPHPEHTDNADADGCGAPITFWQGGTNNLIERNIIINCRKGIELGISQGTGVNKSIIRNNIVYRAGNQAGGDIGISVNDSPDSKVYNNTVILNGTFNPGNNPKTIEYRFSLTTGLEIVNNLCDGEIWVRTSGLITNITNNIVNADESWFVDAKHFDLHLKSIAINSIDKGISLTEVPDDIDKNQRPINKIYDIGADEYFSDNTSYKEINSDNKDLIVFPNPAFDYISISFTNGINQSIYIYNSLGIEIKRFEEKDLFEKNSTNISTEEFPSGIYYCMLNFGIYKITRCFVVLR